MYLMMQNHESLAGDGGLGGTRSGSPVLVAEELRKSYGPREALRGLSFSLQAGRILGFLGPNGAGKTTAIRILTTMMEPSSGSFSVDGIPATEPEQIRRRIGVLPENLGLPKQITGLEYLNFYGQLYGRTPTEAKANSLRLLEGVGLQKRAKSLIGSYSHGMRQRLGIARALVNDPVVVFLDEPTLGLDPRGQQELLTLVRRIARERNSGVVLCSHALTEIESICDDVVILSAGQVVAAGSVVEVIGQAKPQVVQRSGIRICVPLPSVEKARQQLEALPDVADVTLAGETEGWLRVALLESTNGDSAGDQYSINRMLDALIRADIPILSVHVEGVGLQDAFLRLTEEIIR
jgi:ABC-2 type transport system ATP-binding protein